MPLKALWWVEDPKQQDIITASALGAADIADTDRERWRWQAMIVQTGHDRRRYRHLSDRPSQTEGIARA